MSSSINNPIQIDSILIFNSDSTRFFTTVNKRKLNFKGASSDLILDFGGAKIGGKWYFFFMGVSMQNFQTLNSKLLIIFAQFYL
jgi:hypothetical protein